MYNFGGIFGIFRHFIPEQIATAKVKKNRRNMRKSWLRCISIGRTRDILDLLSLGKSIEKILQRYPV